MKVLKYIAVVLFISSLGACERVIDLGLPTGDPLPYVDAWITDQPGVQTIKFLKAVNYMDKDAPEPIANATISVTDVTSNKTYPFTYSNGAYTYDAGSARIGFVGHLYKLNITYNGEQFMASDTLKRNTTIDSLTYEYKETKNGDKEGMYAKLYAHDLPGIGDYYWIRTYRNGVLNAYVQEMVSIDGGFSENGITDGYAFVGPFRDDITSGEKPYEKGDNVKVLIRSMSRDSYYFMDQLIDQLSNYGLFSKVMSNIPANVNNLQTGSKTKIYGWFGTVAEVSQAINIQ